MNADPVELDGLYETLARYAWWRRAWRRPAPGERLELRKRLGPPQGDGPSDHREGLDQWLLQQAVLPPLPRILDLGCGFGISLMRWVETTHGSGVGVTRSRFQAERARAEAQRRGLAERCRFAVQDFTAHADGPFDAVLAIESLGHAADLGAVLRNVHDLLEPGGRLIWLDDCLRAPAQSDVDVRELSLRWSSPPLPLFADREATLAAAGLRLLRTVDLTPQVPIAPISSKDRRERRLMALHHYVPLRSLRRLIDAFLGGIALERLYARRLASYQLTVAIRPEARW